MTSEAKTSTERRCSVSSNQHQRTAAFCLGVKQRALRNRLAGHFLKAQSLGAKLHFVGAVQRTAHALYSIEYFAIGPG